MDYLIFFFILFIFLILIIYGLPFKSNTNMQSEPIMESFKTSSENDVKQGASTFYDWGLRNSDDVPEECDIEPPPKSKSCSGGKCLGDKNTYVQNDYYVCSVFQCSGGIFVFFIIDTIMNRKSYFFTSNIVV